MPPPAARYLALAGAALLGVGAPAWRAWTGCPDVPVPDQIGPADAEVGGFRPWVASPGARVAVGVTEDPRASASAQARAFAAAYALAPAVVRPLVLPACRLPHAAGCALWPGEALLLCDGSPEAVLPIAARHGLTRTEISGGCLLFRSPAP